MTVGKTPANQKADDEQLQGSLRVAKETEPGGDTEAKLVKEIVEKSDAIDKEGVKEVREAIAQAKEARPEPEIAQDLKSAGVRSPQQEADEVIQKGSSVNLPLSREEYNLGIHQKIKTAVVNKVVVGASSLFALATRIGRLIKIAHKHAMRVVFKKGRSESAN